MAVPKRKVSKSRRDSRRSAVSKLNAPALAVCPKCNAPKAPHKVCPECGYVNEKLTVKDGKIVVKAAEKEEAKTADKADAE